MDRAYIVTNAGKTHIIGKCQHCGKEHNGRMRIAITPKPDGDLWIEVGVTLDSVFHVLENLSLTDALTSAGLAFEKK